MIEIAAFYAFLIAFVVGAILAYPILKGLIALKSRQTIYNLAPETHQKKQGTPTMGGLIVLAGLLVSVAVMTQNLFLVLWIIGFALIGFADDFIVPRLLKDKRGLGWKQKIIAQLLLAIAATYVFRLPFLPGPVCLMAFMVLFFCNAYNFADGLDALAGSLGIVLCFGFSFLAMHEGQFFLVPTLAALAGAFLPFLFLNAPPAKVFMGDVGSLPIGALFGAVATLSVVQNFTALTASGFMNWPAATSTVVWHWTMMLPVFILSFVLVAELVPVPLQVAYYKLTKKRLFPMTPIHHSFEVKGWPESRVVWSFLLAQMTLVILALGVMSFFPRGGMWVFGHSQPYHYYGLPDANGDPYFAEAPR